MRYRAFKGFVAVAVLVVAGAPSTGTVHAQRGQELARQSIVIEPALQAAAEARAYWTPERLASAKPLDLRAAIAPAAFEPTSSSEAPVSVKGARPTAAVQPNNSNLLFDPSTVPAFEEEPGLDQAPAAFGTSGLRYTNTRNVPFSQTTDNAYPHRTVGKWFFTKPGVGNFVCSASVIRHRIVVTAGHCVHSGNGSATGWFTNFLFVPAYRNGAAPFGSWTRSRCGTTSTWFSGGGGVPNAADYAMCDMNDRNSLRIGTVTGFLGWITGSLAQNHAHMFGYPCNLDNCLYMNQTSAGAGPFNGNNTYIYGSNQRGGVSGGPFIQNYGSGPACSAGCSPSLAGRNQVIGIASYISTSTSPHYLGSSVPDNRWVSLWNTMCALRAGNCA